MITATVPAIASRPLGAVDELAAVHGVAGLAARARASRWQRTARQLAVLHVHSLANDRHRWLQGRDLHVELDLDLAGHVVTVTLLTTSGLFVLVVHDRDPNDTGSILGLGPSLERHAQAASELADLTGIKPEIVLYSPYGTAPARTAYMQRPVLTACGPEALGALLDERRGCGPSHDALARLYDADASPGFVARVSASSRRRHACQAAAGQIEGLASADRVVELDLALGGQTVTATLLTVSGSMLIVVRDQSAADLSTFVDLGQRVAGHGAAATELDRLTGLRPDIVVYSPHGDEPARSDYIGRPVLTVSGPAALKSLLDEQPGRGLRRETLARFRDAAKPLGRMSGDDLTLRTVGRDSPGVGGS